ncbi:MAG: hypothetical protein PHF74_06110 [Dehalococcoidales bacterium]|nr:hypothetical protein [Dehalococcoidales bacterium]
MWVLVALACLVALIIILLCIPVDIFFRIERYEKSKFKVHFGWLFGLIKKELKPAERKSHKEKKRQFSFGVLKRLPVRRLLKSIKRFLVDISGRINIRKINIDMTAGFDDPAETGYLCAAVYPVLTFYSSEKCHINFNASFEGKAILQGYGEGELRFFPIRFIIPIIRFIFSGTVFKTIRIMMAERWKRKK